METVDSLGIGVDIESVDRFEGLARLRDSRLLERLFTPGELDYCFARRPPAPHLAARYAAKEAVIKALSSLGRSKPRYRDIEVRNNEDGVPQVTIHRDGFSDLRIYLSLSHCRDKAVAFTLVTRKRA